MTPEGSSLPVYGPTAESALLEAVGRAVRLVGKAIDVEGGGGVELWLPDPAAVRDPEG